MLGLSGTLAGMALAVALLFDAVTDPLAGSLSDNWKSKRGRRHPFMYASAVPLALAFLGLFSPPEGMGQWGLFFWLTLFAILTRGAMTLYHVPHLALGAEMSENFDERNKIVAYRQFFGTIGTLAVSVIGLRYFFADANGGRLAVENYTPFALTLGVLMVITIWYSAWGTKKEIPHLSSPPVREKRNPLKQLVLDVRAGASNQSFRWLFFGVLVVFIMAGVNAVLDLYMWQYFWELSSDQMLWLQLATIAGLLIGVPLAAPLLRRTDKRFGVILGTAAWAVFQLLPVVLRLGDVFPDNGTTDLVVTLIVFKFLQGVLLQQAFISFGSAMADVADEHELESGARQEGLFFGAIAFSSKATSGFGNLIGGIGLDIISWPRGTDIVTAADVPAETLVNLGILYGPVVAAFAIVSLWCYTHYILTKERHADILRHLETRRRQKPPDEAAESAREPT